jgi:hypothetical protein
MSLIDRKRNVFTTIGSYTSFMEQNKPARKTDLFPSINNKNDVVPYLLDVLKTVAGTDSLKELIGGMVTKLVASGETKMKDVLKKQFTQSNSGDNLPTWFSTDGLTIPIPELDVVGKLKVSPESKSGLLMYQKTIDTDKLFYDAILNGYQSFGDMNVGVEYMEASNSFKIKPTDSNVKIGEFFYNYIDNTQLFDSNEIVMNVMDGIYGTLSNTNNRTEQQILEQLVLQKKLEQIQNGNDSFVILPKDYLALERKAKEMSNGIVYYDMGCGLLPSKLSFNSLNELNNIISGSTDSFLIGNAIAATIAASTTGNTETVEENKETIKDGFFQRFINILVNQFSFAMTSQPQIKMLLAIMSSFQSNINVPATNSAEYKTFIKCMINELLRMVAEFIFFVAMGYLIELLTPVIKKLLSEKINQFRDLMISLVSGNRATNIT